MEKEREILKASIAQSKSKLRSTLNMIVKPKSAEASEEARKKGNTLLLQQKEHNAQTHKEIFSHYCESIALAPMESQELALAYGNRSYLLLHMHKYEDCIKDIDRALKMLNSDVLKAKLLCRKAECLKRLGSSDVSSVLEMVQSHAEKTDIIDKMKLLKMVDVVKSLTVDTKKIKMNSREKIRISDYLLPVTDDYSSRVLIERSEKYGRQLVAAKDYKPGDIIFVEKMYASAPQQRSSFLACDYCLKLVWSSIPCSYCDWSMYCSESCMEEAWNNYHDIECFLVSHLKVARPTFWNYLLLPIRVLITAIKEAGDIANLKRELELLDQCAANPSKDFLKNGRIEINSIKNGYFLASDVPQESVVEVSTLVPLILIGLTKYSKLKDNFIVKKIEDLETNEDIIFLGTLLIRLLAVLSCNGCTFTYDELGFLLKQCEIVHSDARRCFSILFSLLNHSCFPTAEWRITEQNKLLVYALQPIKKNSQIFISYGFTFDMQTKLARQNMLLLKYNFNCDCQACVEAWPPIKLDGADSDKLIVELDLVNFISKGQFSFENIEEVKEDIEQGRQLNESHIKKLSLSMTQCSHWKQPSPSYCDMIDGLRQIFTSMYSPKSLLFDKCG